MRPRRVIHGIRAGVDRPHERRLSVFGVTQDAPGSNENVWKCSVGVCARHRRASETAFACTYGIERNRNVESAPSIPTRYRGLAPMIGSQ